MKISMIQMSSQPDRAGNLAQVLELMHRACTLDKPDLLVLPEHFDWTGGTPAEKRAAADRVPGGRAYEAIRGFAREIGVAVHAGSLLEGREGDEKIYNTSVIFDATGSEIGCYRKIHLFDITAPDGTRYAESAAVRSGETLLVYELAGFRIGCAICYDLRFSRLFDRLADLAVDLVILPAAFTRQTGEDHWDILCRARAIEFQCYLAACGQCGSYVGPDQERRFMYGHSMLVDPWGRIVAQGGTEIGVIEAVIDTSEVERVRAMIPMTEHRVVLRDVPVILAGSQVMPKPR